MIVVDLKEDHSFIGTAFGCASNDCWECGIHKLGPREVWPNSR